MFSPDPLEYRARRGFLDIPRITGGRVLHVLMNGELDQAMGLLGSAEGTTGTEAVVVSPARIPTLAA